MPLPLSDKPATALAAALGLMLVALGIMLACLAYLHSAATNGVPFDGRTAQLGDEYVWANRVAVGFLIVASVLFAHALARVVQRLSRWRR